MTQLPKLLPHIDHAHSIEDDYRNPKTNALTQESRDRAIVYFMKVFGTKEFDLWNDADWMEICEVLRSEFSYMRREFDNYARVNRTKRLYGRDINRAPDFVRQYFWFHGLDSTPKGIYDTRKPIPDYDPSKPAESIHKIVRARDDASKSYRQLIDHMVEHQSSLYLKLPKGEIQSATNKHLDKLRSDYRAKVASNIAFSKVDMHAFAHVVDTVFDDPAFTRTEIAYILYHVMWQTQRRMLGYPPIDGVSQKPAVIDPMMAILYSGMGGTGKSLFWDSFFASIGVAYDESNFVDVLALHTLDLLRENFVLKIDEMAGIESVDIADVKALLDKPTTNRRAAHAKFFESVAVPVLVGTTNLPLTEIVNDVTWNRRMVVIYMKMVQPEVILKLENDGWFLRMWRSVDPMKPSWIRTPAVWQAVQKVQNSYRRQSEPEEWARITGGMAKQGYSWSTDVAYNHYVAWRQSLKRGVFKITRQAFEFDIIRCSRSFEDFPWSVTGNILTRR